MLLIYAAIGAVGVLCVGSWVAEVGLLLVRAAAITVWATLEAVFSFVARIGIALVRPAVNLSRNYVRSTRWEGAGAFRRILLAIASVVDDSKCLKKAWARRPDCLRWPLQRRRSQTTLHPRSPPCKRGQTSRSRANRTSLRPTRIPGKRRSPERQRLAALVMCVKLLRDTVRACREEHN